MHSRQTVDLSIRITVIWGGCWWMVRNYYVKYFLDAAINRGCFEEHTVSKEAIVWVKMLCWYMKGSSSDNYVFPQSAEYHLWAYTVDFKIDAIYIWCLPNKVASHCILGRDQQELIWWEKNLLNEWAPLLVHSKWISPHKSRIVCLAFSWWCMWVLMFIPQPYLNCFVCSLLHNPLENAFCIV